MLDLEFPEKVNRTQDTISLLALICLGQCSPEQTPVILGTNANLLKWLEQLCMDWSGVDTAQTLGITVEATKDLLLNTTKLTSECTEDGVGRVIC